MYFLAQNNEKTGPFTLEQLREMWRAGAVYPQTLYWEDGMADWQPLSRLDAGLLDFGLSTPAAFPVTAGVGAETGKGAETGMAPATVEAATAVVLPPSSLPADAPHSLIAPTTLPSGGPALPPALYGQPGAGMEMPPAAYLSLIFGLLGPFLCLFGHGVGMVPGFALLIAAIVCGHTARAAIRASGHRLPGEGFAIAGLCFGYGCLALGVVLILLFAVGIAFMFSMMQWMGHQ